MSFFAQLLAGAATGIGKGMVDQADYNDKLAAQQELLKEKHANALQLQSQRADDRLFQAQTLAALKGGSSGGGGGVDVFSRLRGSNPEEQRMALGEIRALGGDDAANLAEESILGRAPMRQRPADYVGLPGQSDVGPDAKITERVEYDKMKGMQGLQRMYALIANKGDTKGNAEGEQIYARTDLGAQEAQKMLKDGKPMSAATNRFNEVTNSAKANPLGEEYARIKQAELDLKVAQAGNKVTAGTEKSFEDRLESLEDKRSKAILKLVDATGKDAKKAIQDHIVDLDAKISALVKTKPAASTPTAPAPATTSRTSSLSMRNSYPRPGVAAQAGR